MQILIPLLVEPIFFLLELGVELISYVFYIGLKHGCLP